MMYLWRVGDTIRDQSPQLPPSPVSPQPRIPDTGWEQARPTQTTQASRACRCQHREIDARTSVWQAQ